MKHLKFFIFLSTVCMSVSVNARRKEGCLYNDPSFTGFTLEGECNIRSVLKAVKEETEGRTDCLTKKKELKFLFQMRDWNDVVAQVEIICKKGEEDILVDVNFHDILDLTEDDGDEDRFLKEFYDGGTRLNEEYDSSESSNSLEIDTESIKYFAENVVKDTTVMWPEEIANFEECDFNTIMCCYIQDRQADDDGNCKESNCIDKDPGDNTDICYVDHERSPGSNHVEGGFTVFDESAVNGGEGRAHCHGFAWSTDEMSVSSRYKGNTLFYVTLYDHLAVRGYVRNVPGAPMCGCLEQMPTVSRADCTQVESVETIELTYDSVARTFTAEFSDLRLEFEKCKGDQKNNDLASHLRLGQELGLWDKEFPSEFLVETCSDATSSFLNSQGITRI